MEPEFELRHLNATTHALKHMTIYIYLLIYLLKEASSKSIIYHLITGEIMLETLENHE